MFLGYFLLQRYVLNLNTVSCAMPHADETKQSVSHLWLEMAIWAPPWQAGSPDRREVIGSIWECGERKGIQGKTVKTIGFHGNHHSIKCYGSWE